MTTDDKIQYDALSEEEKMRWYEEKKRKAEEIYEAEIRHLIGPEDEDKYVKIDVLTGDYEIHENSATAGVSCGNGARMGCSTPYTGTKPTSYAGALPVF